MKIIKNEYYNNCGEFEKIVAVDGLAALMRQPEKRREKNESKN